MSLIEDWVITEWQKNAQSTCKIKSDVYKFGEEQLKFILTDFHERSQKIKINIKLENSKYKVTKFFARFTVLNQNSSKNLVISNKIEIEKPKNEKSVLLNIYATDLNEEEGYIYDDTLRIKIELTEESSVNSEMSNNEDLTFHPPVVYDNKINDGQKKEKYDKNWEINNFFDEKTIIYSETYGTYGLGFKLYIDINSMQTSDNDLKVYIKCEKVPIITSKKYTFCVKVENADPLKSLQRCITHNFTQRGEEIFVQFDLKLKDLNDDEDWISFGALCLKVYYGNFDFSDDIDSTKHKKVDTSSDGVCSYNTGYRNNYSSSYYTDRSKEETGYVGLRNQGATCYMNSMLQSLFHIPVFRSIVYKLPTTGTEDVTKSIPLCLQRLFVKMQCNDSACSTKSLTKSFGWDDYQTIVQHDVQEFCRVLIDNLEEKTKKSPIDGEIANLFRGKFRSFVRCTDVEYESSRIEDFYDLSLVVKDTPDLRSSFKKYVETELLMGENKYSTEQFGKQDAKMGTEFLEFPSVLHLHLRRFEYDFTLDRMNKIYSNFEFPPTIDLSEFLAPDADRTKSNIYDLYGVLVHSGSVYGGHYYAFLRTTTGTQWFQFNDSTVSKATTDQAINENYGGSSSSSTTRSSYYYYSNEKQYSAYMLVYVRQEDVLRIFTPVDDSDIPVHLKDYLKNGDDDTNSSTVTITVTPEDAIRVNSIKKLISFECKELQKTFTFSKSDTHSTLYEKITEAFSIEESEVRLWRTFTKFTPNKIIANDSITISDLMTTNLFLQRKPADETLDTQKLVVFMKFFHPSLQNPIQYIGTTLHKKTEPVSQLFPIVNQRLGFPEDSELLVFLESSDESARKLKNDHNFKIEYPSAQFLVFQLKPGVNLPQTSYRWSSNEDLSLFVNKEKSDEDNKVETEKKTDPEKADEIGLQIVSYNKVMGEKDLKKVSEFYMSLKEQIEATAYNYNEPDKQLLKLVFPPYLHLKQLKEFIVKVFNLPFDPENDTLLLYKKDYSQDEPSSQHLTATTESSTIQFDFTSYYSKPRVYYRFHRDISEQELLSLSTIDVSISEDGYTVSKRQKVLIEKCSSISHLKEKLIEMSLLRGDEVVRVSSINDHNYEKAFKDDDTLSAYNTYIRFDVVPEHQIEIDQENELLTMGAHITTEYNRAKLINDPFYIIIKNNETIEEFTSRLKDTLKLGNEFKRCHLMLDDKYPVISKTKFLKPGKTIGEQIADWKTEIPRIYIVHPHKQKSYRDESVKIYN